MSNVKHDKKYWEQYGQNFNAEWSSPFEPESVVQNFLKVLDTPAVTLALAEEGLQVDRETLKEFIKDRQAEWHSQGDGYSPSIDTNSLPTNPVVCNYDSPVVTNALSGSSSGQAALGFRPADRITNDLLNPARDVPTPPYGRASTSLEVIANKVRVLEDKLYEAQQSLAQVKGVNSLLSDQIAYERLKADAYRMVWSAREYLLVNYPDTDCHAMNVLAKALQELSKPGIDSKVIRDKYVAEKKSRQVYFTDKFKEALKAATPEQFHPGELVSFDCPKPLTEKLIDNVLYSAESFGVELRVRKRPVEGTGV